MFEMDLKEISSQITKLKIGTKRKTKNLMQIYFYGCYNHNFIFLLKITPYLDNQSIEM